MYREFKMKALVDGYWVPNCCVVTARVPKLGKQEYVYHHNGVKFQYLGPLKKIPVFEYIGKKSKSGKEIYMGDILKDDTGDLHEVCFGELPLGKSGDCICTYQAFYARCIGKLGSPPYYDCTEIADWMEVVGHITNDDWKKES